jgi:hypothetical protein
MFWTEGMIILGTALEDIRVDFERLQYFINAGIIR